VVIDADPTNTPINLVQRVPPASEAAGIYGQVGGDAAFRRLVDTFYTKVEQDPVLRPLFPDDLGPGKERQFLFLTQFFGGPPRYNEQRGHPRLRARHLPFPIGAREAEAWLGHMHDAIDETGIAEPARTQMRNYFAYTARFLINQTAAGSEDSER
jgi:hemoglobin